MKTRLPAQMPTATTPVVCGACGSLLGRIQHLPGAATFAARLADAHVCPTPPPSRFERLRRWLRR